MEALCNLKTIHIVLNQEDKPVIDTIKLFDNFEIVQIDYSLDTAYYYIKENPTADILLTSEFVRVSAVVDGKQINKDTAFLRRIRDIKLTSPGMKIVILCAEEREYPENQSFLSSLVSIGVYDFYLATNLNPEMLEKILSAPPKDITHVSKYLPGGMAVRNADFKQEIEAINIQNDKSKSFSMKNIPKKLTGYFERISKLKKPIIKNTFKKSTSKEELNKSVEYPPVSEESLPEKERTLSHTTVGYPEAPDYPETILAKPPNPFNENLDPLTNLPGRITLEQSIFRLIGEKYPFSLAVCDLDYFKKVNDNHGHLVGDMVLKKFAAFLRQSVRRSDIVLRYGGEEFVLVFPGLGKREMAYVIQKIRLAWKGQRIYDSTFSAGIAAFPEDGNSQDALFEKADKALYKAKKSGRNMVVTAGETVKENENVITLSRCPARVWAVVGAAPRVGATSFVLLLAGYLKKNQVEILDAAGGRAHQWARNSDVPIRMAPPFSIAPGLTIVDCGPTIPEEIIPLAEKLFIVTDLSPMATNIQELIKLNSNIYLIGNRNAPLKETMELANLWGIEYLCTLKDDPSIKHSEITQTMPSFRRHKKELNQIRRFVS